jgi:hypothetical protein
LSQGRHQSVTSKYSPEPNIGLKRSEKKLIQFFWKKGKNIAAFTPRSPYLLYVGFG